MARRKLLVRRKGHYVKGHYRRTPSGKKVYVKRHYVPPYSYRMVDKGKPGRTPKAEQWYEPKGHLYGWNKNASDRVRHSALLRGVRRDGYATIMRRLNALRNVSTDKKTDRMAERDMRYLRKKFRGK